MYAKLLYPYQWRFNYFAVLSSACYFQIQSYLNVINNIQRAL